MVFSVGLVLIVTPVTTTALTDIPLERQGVASGANNALARIAGLIAIAVLPAAAGLSASVETAPADLLAGISTAMVIAALATASGGIIAWFGLRPRDCRSSPDIVSPEGAVAEQA